MIRICSENQIKNTTINLLWQNVFEEYVREARGKIKQQKLVHRYSHTAMKWCIIKLIKQFVLQMYR